MKKAENWGNDPTVKKWNQKQKTKKIVYIKTIFLMFSGGAMYLIGGWLWGLPQFLIALGIPLFLLGAFAFYGQAVSNISINSSK